MYKQDLIKDIQHEEWHMNITGAKCLNTMPNLACVNGEITMMKPPAM